jgi:hypothetical protein
VSIFDVFIFVGVSPWNLLIEHRSQALTDAIEELRAALG